MAEEKKEKQEEKKEEKKEGNKEEKERGMFYRLRHALFGEKADRYTTFGMLFVGLGYLARELWKKHSSDITAKGLELAEKKAREFLGLDIEQAKKSLDDEFLYRVALYGYNKDPESTERKSITEFKAILKAFDPEWAEAFVLFIAQELNKHAKDSKKISRLGKGKNAPRVEEAFKLYDCTYTSDFLKELNSKQSIKEKIEFLKDENVFSLIKKKKSDKLVFDTGTFKVVIDEVYDKAEKVVKGVYSGVKAVIKDSEEPLEKIGKGVGKGISVSAKAVDKEFDNLGKWMDKNIHKKVKFDEFFSEWTWFLNPFKKKYKRWKKSKEQIIRSRRRSRSRPPHGIMTSLRNIASAIENYILAKLAS